MQSNDVNKPGAEVVPLRTALGKFARLLDEFSSNLRVWRDAVGGGYEQRWKDLHSDPSASLIKTLDEFMLEVFRRQLIFLRALRDLYVKEVYEAADSDPFSVPEQANRFRSKADLKLLYLEDQIQQLKIKLGQAAAEAEEDLFEIPMKQAAPVTKAAPVESLPIVAAPEPAAKIELVPPEPEPAPIVPEELPVFVTVKPAPPAPPAAPVITLDELKRRADSLRRAHRAKNDLQIKSASGVETVSLQYYAVPNGADGSITKLDLERFVASQKLALNGALKMIENLFHQRDEARRRAILARIQDFIRSMYENARVVLEPQGMRLLPYTGRRINREVLLNFEAKLRMSQWASANDVEDFRGLFNARLEWPLGELLDDPEERRKYYESIVFAAEN
jgi:hypothetical protein